MDRDSVVKLECEQADCSWFLRHMITYMHTHYVAKVYLAMYKDVASSRWLPTYKLSIYVFGRSST